MMGIFNFAHGEFLLRGAYTVYLTHAIGVIEEIGQRLKELAARISLVIVEQHLELALAVAAYAYVLDRGRVALAGPSEEVKRDPQLLRYLAP
jgi:branched-chain amino acid transport system ATP-binding protein